jgi:hypothetical protein
MPSTRYRSLACGIGSHHLAAGRDAAKCSDHRRAGWTGNAVGDVHAGKCPAVMQREFPWNFKNAAAGEIYRRNDIGACGLA